MYFIILAIIQALLQNIFMQYEPMNEKQNSKFLLDKLYPQYFNPSKLKMQSSCQQKHRKSVKTEQDHKIQSKLKKIIYNLEREAQQQIFTKNKLNLDKSRKSSQFSKATLRSFSQKSLKSRAYSQKFQAEISSSKLEQKSERNSVKQKMKKIRELNKITQKSQMLILPKIKRGGKQIQNSSDKQFLKKKYRLSQLQEKQQQLGKIVLQKVQRHFALEKEGCKHYYQRIKSQQGIDESLIDFLKNKVNKANLSLNYSKH